MISDVKASFHKNFSKRLLQLLINWGGLIMLYLVFTVSLIDYDTLGKNLNYFFGINLDTVTARFHLWLVRIIYGFWGIYLIFCLYLWRKKRVNFYYVEQVYKLSKEYALSIFQSFLTLNSTQKIILFTFFFGLLIYRIMLVKWIPFEYDELTSLIFFIRFSPTYPLRWYGHVSNNHVLYSFAADLFEKTGIGYVWALRLPPLLASLFISVVLFHFFYKRYGFNHALSYILIFNFLFPMHYYAMIGRGYAFHIFFASLGFLAVYKIVVEGQNRIRFFFILAGSSILGFYTAPSYLYAFLSFHAVIFVWSLRNFQVLKRVFLSGLAVVLGVVGLFTPIMMANGLESMTHPNHRDFFVHSYCELFSKFTGIYGGYVTYFYGSTDWGGYLFVLVFLSMIYLGLFRADKSTRRFVFVFCFLQMMPIFFLLTHRVFVFNRIWSVMHILNVTACFMSLKSINYRSLIPIILSLFIIIQVYFLSEHILEEHKINLQLTQGARPSPQQYREILLIAETLHKPLEKKAKIYYNYPWCNYYISYYLLEKKYTYYGKVGYNIVGKPSEADYLIIHNLSPKLSDPKILESFQIILKTSYFVLYKKKLK